jgi:hypothetical protein
MRAQLDRRGADIGLSAAGAVAHGMEHSIPAVASLRYSITFRNFRDA